MIEISNTLLAEISAEGEKAYPNECCGFIIGELLDGEHRTAEKIFPCENEFDESEKFHRFLIEPEQMLKVQRECAKAGKDIVGFYHSHPDCRAIPSEYDRSHALPLYSYVIVSVVKGERAETLCWQLDDKQNFQSEEIRDIDRI